MSKSFLSVVARLCLKIECISDNILGKFVLSSLSGKHLGYLHIAWRRAGIAQCQNKIMDTCKETIGAKTYCFFLCEKWGYLKLYLFTCRRYIFFVDMSWQLHTSDVPRMMCPVMTTLFSPLGWERSIPSKWYCICCLLWLALVHMHWHSPYMNNSLSVQSI